MFKVVDSIFLLPIMHTLAPTWSGVLPCEGNVHDITPTLSCAMSCPGNVRASNQYNIWVSLALLQLKAGSEAGCFISPNLGLGDTTG